MGLSYSERRPHDRILSPFDTVPPCDGQTDGRTDGFTIASTALSIESQAMLTRCKKGRTLHLAMFFVNDCVICVAFSRNSAM